MEDDDDDVKVFSRRFWTRLRSLDASRALEIRI